MPWERVEKPYQLLALLRRLGRDESLDIQSLVEPPAEGGALVGGGTLK